MPQLAKIIYTITDEAPALATQSLLPIIKAFVDPTNIKVETKNISLASRILANFSSYLTKDQQVTDDLHYLGELAKKPEANIIKLPNISASVPQLEAAIKELQDKGYAIPDYPKNPQNEKEIAIKEAYNKVKGSAVNPVLREGNSDRRAPRAVKNYAKKNPHQMGAWSPQSKTHVATMSEGDFLHNEKSVTISKPTTATITLHTTAGEKIVLKNELPLLEGEIIDGTFLSKKALIDFLKKQVQDAKDKGVLFSLHMKATMMKVSDPIIFGYAVKVFFEDVFSKHQALFDTLKVDVNNGFGDLLHKIAQLPQKQREEIESDIASVFSNGPALAMVNSDKGITNLHVPSDVIIDASIPAMIRSSGQMWNAQGKQQDTKVTIPDSTYASLYDTTIKFCIKNGAFDPTTMGTVPNVGLMAQKAEEYGSHDKTFEIPASGTIVVTDQDAATLMTHEVQKGDIWRMCQVKDIAIQDWVKLAVSRANATGWPTVFWLDEERAHDEQMIKKVKLYLQDYNTNALDIKILSTEKATEYTLERVKKGENTISVTGNVLRDYLTDLFPILELGTSAKMLSIVPLINGGGLFETGAGGSAPKHVQQFIEEGHLRWDSLGEFLALTVSLNHLGKTYNKDRAFILEETLNNAIEKILKNKKGPSRKVNELDNRGSHFYLAKYWAEELAKQSNNEALQQIFIKVSAKINENETKILDELLEAQGSPVDIEGYYSVNDALVKKQMRPSQTFNAILADIK